MKHSHLRQYVIRPVLKELKEVHNIGDDLSAAELLVLTAATESLGGKFLHPAPTERGSACGIYQMEPSTAYDLMQRIVDRFEGKLSRTGNIAWAAYGVSKLEEEICGSLRVATYLARMYYWFIPKMIPPFGHTELLAWYWKEYWNRNGEIPKALGDYAQYLNDNL